MDLILFFIGLVLIFVFFPVSIIVTIVKLVKKKNCKFWACLIPCFLILGFAIALVGLLMPSKNTVSDTSSNSAKLTENTVNEIATNNNIVAENDKTEEENKNNKEEVVANESIEEVTITKKENTENEEENTENEEEKNDSIFHGEIGLNKSYYIGKEVTTSFKCDYIISDMTEISSESNLCYGGIEAIFKEPQDVSVGEYITVSGLLCEEYGATTLKDSVIICKGTEAQENYNNEFNLFKEEFMNSEAVSYEDLTRYPDTYKDKKFKLEVDISDVESDGVFLNGTITGLIPGTDNEIAIYDYRQNREPRIKEGDKLTIYVVGNKTTTVKIKNGKGLFAETLDEYEIPCVYLQFIEFR